MKELFEIVHLVYSDKVKNERELAESMFMTLDKANSLFKYAVQEEYISDEYEVLEKGLLLLEKYRVDNAVILATGLGFQLVPTSFESPQGLLRVQGEMMIERQIKQLHEVGIHDITVVVGSKKEKYEVLSDQYDVKLIFMPDDDTKNNLTPLYYAREILKNTYILTADMYMPDNIYRTYEYESFLAVTYFEGEVDEWAVTMNRECLITDINPSGGCDTWVLYGPAFFTSNFSSKLIQYLDESREHSCWEYVYKKNIDVLDLYARKYTSGTIEKITSLEDLRAFDSRYLTDARLNSLKVIMEVFDVALHEITGLEPLEEGMTNDSFIFEVDKKRYVFRNPGLGTDDLINRQQEASVYAKIKHLNISDEVIYLDPEKGYKITKFIPNSRTIDMKNPQELRLAFDKLRILHKAKLTVDHEFDIEERIAFYLKLCREVNAKLFKDFNEVYKDIKQVIHHLKQIDRPKVLSHIDSIDMNFLYATSAVTLLDWEYAAMADPLIDIAMFVVFGGLQEEEIMDVLDLYLEREHTEEEKLVVLSYVSLSGFLWSLWTQYKQASGEEFGTYGMEQYDYARKYSRIVLMMYQKNQ